MELRSEKEAVLQRLAHGSGIASDGAHASQRACSALEHLVEWVVFVCSGVYSQAQ